MLQLDLEMPVINLAQIKTAMPVFSLINNFVWNGEGGHILRPN